jgi:hypothetical protein
MRCNGVGAVTVSAGGEDGRPVGGGADGIGQLLVEVWAIRGKDEKKTRKRRNINF